MVAQAAILSLGLIGAGSNNHHIRGSLRNLSEYYRKKEKEKAETLFLVRTAQGLLHLGKGLLTLSPIHSDGFLCSPTALARLMSFLQLCLVGHLPRQHHLLYYLAIAMKDGSYGRRCHLEKEAMMPALRSTKEILIWVWHGYSK